MARHHMRDRDVNKLGSDGGHLRFNLAQSQHAKCKVEMVLLEEMRISPGLKVSHVFQIIRGEIILSCETRGCEKKVRLAEDCVITAYDIYPGTTFHIKSKAGEPADVLVTSIERK